MNNEKKGSLIVENAQFAIVASRFNNFIVKNLVEGAQEAFQQHGIKPSQITTVWVPGAFEIPVTTQKLAKSKKFDAIICLGAIIRGATAHFDHVASQSIGGVSQVALQEEMPILCGILTTETIEQAIERAGSKAGNKGYEVTLGALEMVSLFQQLSSCGNSAGLDHNSASLNSNSADVDSNSANLEHLNVKQTH